MFETRTRVNVQRSDHTAAADIAQGEDGHQNVLGGD